MPFVGKPGLVFPRMATVCWETVALRMAAVRIRIHLVFLRLVAVCREIVFPRMAAVCGETVALRMAAVRIRIHLFDMVSSTA